MKTAAGSLGFLAALAAAIGSASSAHAAPAVSASASSRVPDLAGVDTACRSGAPNVVLDGIEGLVRCETIKRGPQVGKMSTFEVGYTNTTGPNFHIRLVALVSRPGRVLWTHEAFDIASFPFERHDHALIYRWRYADQGRRIEVTGLTVTGKIDDMWNGVVHGRRSRLPIEHYCYSAEQGLFAPC